MKRSIQFLLITIFIFGIAFLGCKKEDKNPSCYDSSLVHNGACTTDCPGFEGCDGKTYCNSCEAARNGIEPK